MRHLTQKQALLYVLQADYLRARPPSSSTQYNLNPNGATPKTMAIYWCGAYLDTVSLSSNVAFVHYSKIVTANASYCNLDLVATSAGGGGM